MTWTPEEEMGPQRMYSLTPWVRRLLVANLLVFLIQKTLLVAPEYVGAFGFDPMKAWQQPWSFITYMFLHGNILHLLFNMLTLYVFGRSEEMGPQRMYSLTPWVRRLLVANLLVFLIQKTLLVAPEYVGAFGFDPMKAWQQPWSFITYMFLHGNILHLLFNMLTLYVFG